MNTIILILISVLLSSAMGLEFHYLLNLPRTLQTELMVIAIAISLDLMLVLSVQFAWRKWQLWKVQVKEENPPPPIFTLLGDPFLNPSRGVMFKMAGEDGRLAEVIIEPKWWHLFPNSALSRKAEQEAAVIGNAYCSVVSGSEPKSLVMIKINGETRGMGSRVSYNGDTYLLTARHVLVGDFPFSVCKGGEIVDIEEWEESYSCGHHFLDFSLVKIHDKYWAKLKVKSAPLVPLTKTCHITAYGGTHSKSLLSSIGIAEKAKANYAISHTASTTKGWSGTPLYDTRGNIVGVHTGSSKLGESNRGTNIGVLLSSLHNFETDFSEISYSELDYDNFKMRENQDDFIEVEIKGMGKYKLGDTSFVNMDAIAWERKKREKGEEVWADASDEDLEDEKSFIKWYSKTMEAATDFFSSHLNGQRAACETAEPPSSPSGNISGAMKKQSSPHTGCPFPSLEDRVASLENLLEKMLDQQSKMLEMNSQNSKSIAGLNEALKQSWVPSFTKQGDSDPFKPRKISQPPVTNSPSDIPKPSQGNASEEKSGTSKRSQKKRRRSRRPKSTPKPPPGSRSRSWVPKISQ